MGNSVQSGLWLISSKSSKSRVQHARIRVRVWSVFRCCKQRNVVLLDFQHSVSVAVTVAVYSRCRGRFRKNRVRTDRSCRCCWGVCAAIARQAQEPGRRVSHAKEWAEFQARTNGRYRKIELDPIWTAERQRRTYGNEERNFLRKLRSSYGILTDERNSYVLCYG